jgi:hypothetical protein
MITDENLAAVHAYLCGDGYLTRPIKNRRMYQIGLRNTEIILLSDFQERFEKVFGVSPKITPKERSYIYSKKIHCKLIETFGSFHSWEWTFPALDKSVLPLWLRAFFDCEGWVVCKSHQNRMIGLDNVNEEGIKNAKKALELLGIKSKLKKRADRNIYTLSIFGKENLALFEKKIGFLHPQKKEKLREALEDYRIYEWEFPLGREEIKKFIKKLFKEKLKPRRKEYLRLFSNKESNLVSLNALLKKFYGVEGRVYTYVNGQGTRYYEININKKESIDRLIKENLLPKEIVKCIKKN